MGGCTTRKLGWGLKKPQRLFLCCALRGFSLCPWYVTPAMHSHGQCQKHASEYVTKYANGPHHAADCGRGPRRKYSAENDRGDAAKSQKHFMADQLSQANRINDLEDTRNDGPCGDHQRQIERSS